MTVFATMEFLSQVEQINSKSKKFSQIIKSKNNQNDTRG